MRKLTRLSVLLTWQLCVCERECVFGCFRPSRPSFCSIFSEPNTENRFFSLSSSWREEPKRCTVTSEEVRQEGKKKNKKNEKYAEIESDLLLCSAITFFSSSSARFLPRDRRSRRRAPAAVGRPTQLLQLLAHFVSSCYSAIPLLLVIVSGLPFPGLPSPRKLHLFSIAAARLLASYRIHRPVCLRRILL